MKNRLSRKNLKFPRFLKTQGEKIDQTLNISRKWIVEFSKKQKRKNNNEAKTPQKVRKPTKGEDHTKLTVPRTATNKTQSFKELEICELLTRLKKLAQGHLEGVLMPFTATNTVYTVKEIKIIDLSKRKIERAKQEVLSEALVLADLGDHPGIPHFFGVCSIQAPFYLQVCQVFVRNFIISGC